MSSGETTHTWEQLSRRDWRRIKQDKLEMTGRLLVKTLIKQEKLSSDRDSATLDFLFLQEKGG